MSTSIVSRTVGGSVDKRLSLSNSQAARLISILDDWDQLRIGVRMSMNSASTSDLTGSPKLAIGVCYDVNNQLGDASTDHFLGVRLRDTQLTYNAGPEPNLYRSIATGGFEVLHKAGTTESNSASGGSKFGLCLSPDTLRTGMLIDITKDAAQWTVSWLEPSAYQVDNASYDWSEAELLAAMQVATLADVGAVVPGSWTVVGPINSPIAVPDEATNGLFNAIQVLWDRSTHAVEFSDIKWRRVA